MIRTRAAEGFVFCATGTLITNKVWIRTTKTCRTGGLMGDTGKIEIKIVK